MAGVYDISCDQGSTFALTISWLDSDGAGVNLSTYAARMDVRPTIESSTRTLALTTENGGIAFGAATGTIELRITAEQTAALAAGDYVYDLELVSGAAVTRILEGAFTVRAEVTR